MGKKVTYNDILPSNSTIAKALFANVEIIITEKDIKNLFTIKRNKIYSNHIEKLYNNIYFTKDENRELDLLCQNIMDIENDIARAEAYYCLFQAAICKRPYNLFHRANLEMRLRDVERSFGNKSTWEKPFVKHMLKFYKELKEYRTLKYEHDVLIECKDAFNIEDAYDLVYIDTPYAKSTGTQESNYFNFYHFLDAMLDYNNIEDKILNNYLHLPYYEPSKKWFHNDTIDNAFKDMFNRYKKSILVISYRSDGHPTPKEIEAHLGHSHTNISINNIAKYKYVFSTKKENTKEIIIVAYPKML